VCQRANQLLALIQHLPSLPLAVRSIAFDAFQRDFTEVVQRLCFLGAFFLYNQIRQRARIVRDTLGKLREVSELLLQQSYDTTGRITMKTVLLGAPAD
jgi:hypothetical protein